MDIPDNLKYSSEHEWLAPSGKTAKIGITGYAAEHIGDIVFVELPKVGSDGDGRQLVRRDRGGEVGERVVRARVGQGDRDQRARGEGARAGRRHRRTATDG